MQFIILLLLFVLSPLLYGTSLTNYTIAIETLVLFVSFMANINKIRNFKLGGVLIAIVLYLIWMIVILLLFPLESTSIIRIVQFIGCASAFLVAATTKWKIRDINLIVRLVSFVILAMFLYWIVFSGFNISNYSFYYENPDTYSSLMFVLLAFLFFSKQSKNLISIVVCLLLILFTGARASLLSAIVFIFVAFIFKNKNIYNKATLFLIIEAVALVAFVIVYPMLMTLDIGSVLDEYSHQYFNKNFFSGRQLLWVDLIEKIVSSPIVGYGLAADPEIAGFTKSSHNLYIQVALQSGFVGLILLVIVIVTIFRRITRFDLKPYSRLSACFIMAVLIHESFEICLTQNAIVFGYMMWFMMGLGCNFCLQGRDEMELKNKIIEKK